MSVKLALALTVVSTAVGLTGAEIGLSEGAVVSTTVTVKLHCAPSAVEHEIVVVPNGKAEPEGGEQVTGTELPQPSVADGEKPTTAEHCPTLADTVIFPGQLMVEGLITVTVNVQVGPSQAVVHVIVVVPTGKTEPDGGEQVTGKLVPKTSITVGVGYVTTAEHWPDGATVVISLGQLIVAKTRGVGFTGVNFTVA